MIVTFISQCEKKALVRTRRVLDAFADRIGDNTWQTVITEDGLIAVKNLLRKSVTKNTAVACHRIATRRRTELVWIVGNRNKFNSQGIVPVNWTEKELFMDLPIETKNILANTQGQSLSQHLFSVGYLAYQLIQRLNINSPNLARSAFIAGVLHDIGKLDPQFQQWVNKKTNKSEEIELPEDGVHIDSTIQGFKKFSFENHPRHHELSWLWAKSLLGSNNQLNLSQTEQIFHGIYWHHTRPYRKDDKFFIKAEGIDKLFIKSLTDSNTEKIISQLAVLFKDIKLIGQKFQNEDFNHDNLMPTWSYPYSLTKDSLPNYKNYNDLSEDIEEFVKDVQPNALNNLVRMAVISADRMVSAMSVEDLTEYLVEGTLANALDDVILDESHLTHEIDHCLNGFDEKYPDSERNHTQAQAAKALADLQQDAEFDDRDNVAVLQGPAGCGKTKIALEWALKTNAKKIVWVCPRVQVCLGLLHDLTQSDYLPNSRIEIFTGEYKKILQNGISFEAVPETEPDNYFSGDIVITTIDQVVNNIISHQKVTGMLDFMQAHVVFDEFHELIPMPAFNLLFAELIEAKKLRKHHANVLLVSATPHDYFVRNVLRLDDKDIIRVPSFNQADYMLEFVSYDETVQDDSPLVMNAVQDNKTTFIITNTAQDAQLGFLKHQNKENSILLHSKYTKNDKAEWFDQVFDCFKRAGNGKYQILRSGPIVQASLNISCERMYTDLSSPEDWLQRLGRLDRFDENKTVNIYTTVLPKSAETGKQSSSKAKFLANMNVWNSTVAWLNFLKNYLQDKNIQIIKVNELYEVYQAFYADSGCQSKIAEDLKKALRYSVQLINEKVMDPISMPSRSKKQKDSVAKIASVSLRGDNRFVQMAVCEIDSQLKPTFLNEYAYPEDIDHSKVIVGLTETTDRIQGGRFEMRDSNKNLLAFMHKKHHNVMKVKNADVDVKASRFDWELLKLARSPEYPIYLSYTPNDLEPIGGERERHQYAMYYVKTAKQPVGIMSIYKLTHQQSVESE